MSLKNWSLLLVLSVLWGGSFFFVEVALEDIPPLTLVFLRVALASLALLIYLKLRGESIPLSPPLWGEFLVMGVLNNAIPFALIVWGQTQITGSVASILNATAPIFTLLVAHWFTADERLDINKMLGVIVGFGGVVVMMLPTLDQGLSWESYGQLAVLAAAICYAFAGVWGKRLKATSAPVNAAGMLVCSSVVMLPVIFILETPFAITPNLTSWLAVVAIALLSTAAAYMIYFRVLASAGATNLLLVTFLIPVSAMLLGIGILGETVKPIVFYGMGIIFLGLILIDGRAIKHLTQKQRSAP